MRLRCGDPAFFLRMPAAADAGADGGPHVQSVRLTPLASAPGATQPAAPRRPISSRLPFALPGQPLPSVRSGAPVMMLAQSNNGPNDVQSMDRCPRAWSTGNTDPPANCRCRNFFPPQVGTVPAFNQSGIPGTDHAEQDRGAQKAHHFAEFARRKNAPPHHLWIWWSRAPPRNRNRNGCNRLIAK